MKRDQTTFRQDAMFAMKSILYTHKMTISSCVITLMDADKLLTLTHAPELAHSTQIR